LAFVGKAVPENQWARIYFACSLLQTKKNENRTRIVRPLNSKKEQDSIAKYHAALQNIFLWLYSKRRRPFYEIGFLIPSAFLRKK
jgi:hypothetical protein